MIPQILAELQTLNQRQAQLLEQLNHAVSPLFASAGAAPVAVTYTNGAAALPGGMVPREPAKRYRAFHAIPLDVKNRIGKLAADGKTHAQIAAILGLSITSVNRIAPQMKRKRPV